MNITDGEFKQLAEYIKKHYGIMLGEGKKALVNGRLYSILTQNNYQSFTEYFDYIMNDSSGNAAINLIDKITTNHTFFMRENEHFTFFKDIVLPYFERTLKDHDLRIWSAGCSSGEEPYTLAMLIDEYFGKQKLLWTSSILATDISAKVLDKAKKGNYSGDDIAAVPTNWRLNYFKKTEGNGFTVADKIKKEVIFRKFNLMEEVFPFKKKFHTIFCRNVMIYFDAKTKHILSEKFYDLLEPGGYFFIGHSESLNRMETRFKYINPALYRKE